MLGLITLGEEKAMRGCGNEKKRRELSREGQRTVGKTKLKKCLWSVMGWIVSLQKLQVLKP